MLFFFLIITKDFREKLREIRERAPEVISEVGFAIAKDLEYTAKKNAPWTDRTGNARRTMEGFEGFESSDLYYITLCGKMHYSPELEMNYGGRYAIILPTMFEREDNIYEEMRDAIGRIDGVEWKK